VMRNRPSTSRGMDTTAILMRAPGLGAGIGAFAARLASIMKGHSGSCPSGITAEGCWFMQAQFAPGGDRQTSNESPLAGALAMTVTASCIGTKPSFALALAPLRAPCRQSMKVAGTGAADPALQIWMRASAGAGLGLPSALTGGLMAWLAGTVLLRL